MLTMIRRYLATPTSYDHWNAPEIWRETPQSRYARPGLRQGRQAEHPRRFL